LCGGVRGCFILAGEAAMVNKLASMEFLRGGGIVVALST